MLLLCQPEQRAFSSIFPKAQKKSRLTINHVLEKQQHYIAKIFNAYTFIRFLTLFFVGVIPSLLLFFIRMTPRVTFMSVFRENSYFTQI